MIRLAELVITVGTGANSPAEMNTFELVEPELHPRRGQPRVLQQLRQGDPAPSQRVPLSGPDTERVEEQRLGLEVRSLLLSPGWLMWSSAAARPRLPWRNAARKCSRRRESSVAVTTSAQSRKPSTPLCCNAIDVACGRQTGTLHAQVELDPQHREARCAHRVAQLVDRRGALDVDTNRERAPGSIEPDHLDLARIDLGDEVGVLVQPAVRCVATTGDRDLERPAVAKVRAPVRVGEHT